MSTNSESNEFSTAPGLNQFIITKEYRRFAEFCDACRRERYVGLCYGPPGVGKTFSARHYAQWDLIEPHLKEYFLPIQPEIISCRTLFYTPSVVNTPRSVYKEVRQVSIKLNCLVEEALALPNYPSNDKLLDYCELLIVDEADRLKMQSLEQLRDIYDKTQMGLILIGMSGTGEATSTLSTALLSRWICPPFSFFEYSRDSLLTGTSVESPGTDVKTG